MKPRRSNQQKIQLVLAGMLAAGMVSSCTRRRDVLNDTYVTDKGYYHSETGGWYPYPWNHYVPGVGYYGGSRGWTGSPHRMVNGIRSVPSTRRVYVAPLPNVPPPAPRPSQIYNYTKPVSSPAATPYRSPTVNKSTPSAPVSKPASSGSFSSGARTGGFGSSAAGSSGS